MTTINSFRHGDLVFTRIDSLPDGAEGIKHNGELVLAEGEMTGHKHVAYADPANMQAVKQGNVIYISLTIPAPLKHQEHKTIEIPMGNWKMMFQRELDPYLDEIRTMAD